MRLVPNAALKMIMATLFRRGHDNAEQAHEVLDVHFPAYRAGDGAAALARQVAALDVHDTEAVAPDLPRLNLPARLVWGEADQFQKVRYGERLARDLSTPLHRIGNGKHFTPEDHPDTLSEEINALVAEVTLKQTST